MYSYIGKLIVTIQPIYIFYRTFSNALWDLSGHFSDDPPVMAALNRIIHAIQEMNKFHAILLDQATRTVLKNLSAFIKVYVQFFILI